VGEGQWDVEIGGMGTLTVVDEQTLLKVALPRIGIRGVDQGAGVGDVREGVVLLHFGDGVR